MTKITVNTDNIVAAVYATGSKGEYYVKVDVPELGLHANSYKVLPSKVAGDDWYVGAPQFYIGYGRKPVTPLELERLHPFRQAIEEDIKKAVDIYTGRTPTATRDVVIEDFDPDAPINLDDIPDFN